MKGTLHITKNGWVVHYPETFNNGLLSIHPNSLSNPLLSTYWVPNREVEFEIDYTEFNLQPYALIKPSSDSKWEDILKQICEQDLNNVGDIFQWLMENYYPPLKIL